MAFTEKTIEELKRGGHKDIETKIADIDESGVVSIYVNGFNNLDYDRDISAPTSFNKTISENTKRIKHLKDHDRKIALGFPLEFTADGYGLLVRSKLNLEKQVVKDVYSDYKFYAENKRTLEHSIGYDVVKYEYDKQKDIRIITEYKLHEYSTISFLGVNQNTPCVGIKSLETFEDLKEKAELLNQMLIKGDYSDEKFMLIEKAIKEIQVQIQNLKSLDKQEPKDITLEVNEPKIEKSEINYINIIKNLKIK